MSRLFASDRRTTFGHLLVLGVALTLSASCGTRVERNGAALPSSNSSLSTPTSADRLPAQAAPSDATAGSLGEASGNASATARAAPHASIPQGTAAPQGTAGAPGAQPTSGGTTKTPTGQASNSPSAAAPSASKVPVPAPSTPPVGSPKAPLVIASVGTYSGPIGSLFSSFALGVQLWVKAMNEHGGLDGHLVKFSVYDDGNDPARHGTQIREAIERQHVVAFVNNSAAFTGRASIKFVEERRVPVIGTEGGSAWVYESPMFFPQYSSSRANFVSAIGGVAEQAVAAGKTKLGTVMCVEGEGCDDVDRVIAEWAPRLGMHQVYRGRGSIGQPDFTATCLAARNAGAEVLLIGLDGSSIGRVAVACARQGYHPIYGSFNGTIDDNGKDNPNYEGMFVSSGVLPWFQTGTPASDEYQAAFKKFGTGLVRNTALAAGWVSAKLLQKAAASLPETPTSEAILEGLWSIKDDTLGGITQPLTFVKDRPATPLACWFNVTLSGGRWVSPTPQAHCRTVE